jgi:uncharacterized protein YjbI with pentapeptide repeats
MIALWTPFFLDVIEQACYNFSINTSDILLEQVQLRKGIFAQTRLNKLCLFDGRVEVYDFSGSIWDKPRLNQVKFMGCRLSGVQWHEAQLDDVFFFDCSLEGAVLVNATCKGVGFKKCKIRNASLEETDLSGVEFFLRLRSV